MNQNMNPSMNKSISRRRNSGASQNCRRLIFDYEHDYEHEHEKQDVGFRARNGNYVCSPIYNSIKMHRRHPAGFTLIELLIVVAIIAILAAIAVPNLLEAQTRSKVSRVKNDLRALATALEAYAVDSRAYPEVIPKGEDIDTGGAWLMKPLTTPTAYISSLPADPFLPAAAPEPLMPPEGRKTYRYTSYPIPPDRASVWGLASNGPDLLSDTRGIYQGYSPGLFFGQDPLHFDWVLYDPTNGTVSRGDVFRGQDFNP